MYKDPIVAEVQRVRKEIFKECNYDSRILGERLKELDRKYIHKAKKHFKEKVLA